MTRATRKRMARGQCPLDSTRFRRGRCPTCQRWAQEANDDYTELLRGLIDKATPVLAQGELTVKQLGERLGTNQKLCTDVLAVLRDAKLVKAHGLARKLASRLTMMGINSGMSGILWVTVGGFARLTPTLLGIILAAAVLGPFLLGRILRRQRRRAA